jgi:sugar lactone lactonase YvrE
VTSLALRNGNGVVITSGDRIYSFDPISCESELIFDSGYGQGFSFNDAVADRQGRLLTGIVDKALVEPAASELVDKIEPQGGLYRIDADRSVTHLGGSIGVFNGPCFSPDGTTMFCNDSWARRIYAFDYDVTSGTPTNRRTFASFPAAGARPDGATVDEEGCLWTAAFEGGEIHRYRPDGTLDQRIQMPVESPTSVAFGGANMDLLFVTSHGRAHVSGTTTSSTPLAGCLFALTGLGVRGIPEQRFRG